MAPACPLSLLELDGSNCHSSYIIVVDELDECKDDNHIKTILQLLAECRSFQRVQLRVFLTSRPEVPIRYGIGQTPDTERQDFVLHNISLLIIDHDISIFLEYNLGIIREKRSLDSTWPGKDVIGYLVKLQVDSSFGMQLHVDLSMKGNDSQHND